MTIDIQPITANETDLDVLELPWPRLDVATAPTMMRLAREALDAGTERLVIDMRRVHYIDSIGVAALVTIRQRAPIGTVIVLANMSKFVRLVSRVTQLHTLFDVYADADSAVRVMMRQAA
jgi:anti-anti-sigma factor